MTTKLILAAISGLLFAGHALAETAAPEAQHHPMAIAARVSAGRTEPIAIDQVNKRHTGLRPLYRLCRGRDRENRESRRRAVMLAGIRFAEDGRLVWTANWVSPFNSNGLARGT